MVPRIRVSITVSVRDSVK